MPSCELKSKESTKHKPSKKTESKTSRNCPETC